MPAGFGSKKRYEDALQIRRRNPLTAVFDFNPSPFFAGEIAFGAAGDFNAAIRFALGNCFGGIANEIEQGLTQHSFISANENFRMSGRDTRGPSNSQLDPQFGEQLSQLAGTFGD